MFQTMLLFLAPALGITANGQSVNGQSFNGQAFNGKTSPDATSRSVHASPDRAGKVFTSMATRIQPGPAPEWQLRTSGLRSIVGNALGFIAFMSGLGMVLRLAEILLS
jgi:hypothetical protein